MDTTTADPLAEPRTCTRCQRRALLVAMHESTKRDAAEVRGMESRDPWRKALLIVRNVDGREGKGRLSEVQMSDRTFAGKVSPEAFAAEVNLRGWGRHVIVRTIAAWDRAAESGLVPPARDMRPGQELESPPAKWSKFYAQATADALADALLAAGLGSPVVVTEGAGRGVTELADEVIFRLRHARQSR